MLENAKSKVAYLKRIFREETPKKYVIVFGIIFFAAFFCESFIFNFKWINSVFDNEITAVPIINGAGSFDDGLYMVTDSTVTIEFNDIDHEIKYLYLRPGENSENKVEVSISAMDEANENFISAPSRTVLSEVEQSQYIRLHFSGKVSSLRIIISGMEGKTLRDSDIRLNVRVPLMFSWGVCLC